MRGSSIIFGAVAKVEGMSRAGEFARVDGVAPALFYVNGVELDAVEGVGLEHSVEGFAVGRVSEMCRGFLSTFCKMWRSVENFLAV